MILAIKKCLIKLKRESKLREIKETSLLAYLNVLKIINYNDSIKREFEEAVIKDSLN